MLLTLTLISFHNSTGDIALLNCTAIVNTSNESLNDKNPVSDSINQLAGPELRDELLKLKGRVEVHITAVEHPKWLQHVHPAMDLHCMSYFPYSPPRSCLCLHYTLSSKGENTEKHSH